MQVESMARMEFHVSRQARDRYEFDRTLFSLSGNVIFADFHAARIFAQKMNDKRDLVSYPEQAVKGGQINAMGLIDEIQHHIVQLYRQQVNPAAMAHSLDWLDTQIGLDGVDMALRRFCCEFPPTTVYRGEISLDAYIDGESAGVPHRQILLEEMLMLWVANDNSAFLPFRELFDDDSLTKDTAYGRIMVSLYDFFETQPPFGPESQNLIDLLQAPARAYPHSLAAQLEYIQKRWGGILGGYLYRLLGSLDLINEEEKAIFLGPGPSLVYEFDQMELEPERFSQDLDWMPRLVLVAKNVYVWMHQLSEKYESHITRLDQIPDEELDTLARWGFTGLWLIGLWERSPASRRVKQLCGNPEAVSSAYSIFDYQVAGDIGGSEAFQNLKDRAWQRGIRMSSDMVPNHMGTYSRWTIEHPDWFVSLDHSPFPAYSFNGPDLSEDERVGIYIEDHYYDRTDAAVVFKRVDRWTGREQYIYHGNDGTSMPWNDTAQLNYLIPEVREAVIQTILHVARQTPVIRFDAAMTLAKKHYQRLWFPEPGSGGDIPTRAGHGLTKAEFDAAMPVEFWREVVDRVAAEAPDTLLLAEAFWLLEGYFVRTLGMHRVYNSAFMNMLRDEDNAKYRLVMKNTLEFDPEILKRFVNFMNNPDEDTAVEQFGKGDKYFGICTMLATLPGLPMLGHGQVEGYAEKYGMEYRRAYWDEKPDGYLVERHEREIFPLLHRRELFAEVRDFLLYDFYGADGSVNEDVFAYSNRSGSESSLVVFHNRFATAGGWIKNSAAYSLRSGGDGDRRLVQKTLGEGLALRDDENGFCIFRDHLTGLEYIRSSKELCESGLYVQLEAYKCHVFLDFREVQDNDWHQYAQLSAYLNGRGVPSIEEALREVFLQPVLHPFRELVNADTFRRLLEARVAVPGGKLDEELLLDVENKMVRLLCEIKGFVGGEGDDVAIARDLRHELAAILQLPTLAGSLFLPSALKVQGATQRLESQPGGARDAWAVLLGWHFTHALGRVVAESDYQERSRSWLDEWLLGKLLATTYQDMGLDQDAAWRAVGVVKILINHERWCGMEPAKDRDYQILVSWLRDRQVQQFLQVNRYRGVLWFNHELFEELLAWMLALAEIGASANSDLEPEQVAWTLESCCDVISNLERAEAASGHQVVELMESARERVE